MPLSDSAARGAKPKPKTYKLFDTAGLFLLVSPGGSKGWRFRYQYGGKAKLISFGPYPMVGLKDARVLRDEAKALLLRGIDPSEQRRQARGLLVCDESFEAIALEWFAKFKPTWAESHAGRTLRRLEMFVFPWLGRRPIREIMAPEVLACLRRIEARGTLETTHRVKQIVGMILRYAVATGRAERDCTGDLRGALPPAPNRHFATITDPPVIGTLLRKIDGYVGAFPICCALQLAPMLFVRPGELRAAEWREIDLAAALWRIPAERMKGRRPHLVPLATQAVAIIRELHPLTGGGRFLFPSIKSAARPISNNTVNAALRCLGYEKDEIVGHGFRHMASTLLNEQGWPSDVIERQLAHVPGGVRGIYNHAQWLQERTRMMQAWADYLDGLRNGAEVIGLRRGA